MAADQDRSIDDLLVREVALEVVRLVRLAGRPSPGSMLEEPTFRIMLLVRDQPRSLVELAELLHVERSTVSRRAGAAVRRGWLQRSVAPGRTQRLISPTDAGRRAFEHDLRLRSAVLAQAMTAYGADRARQLGGQLHEFNDALEGTHVREGLGPLAP